MKDSESEEELDFMSDAFVVQAEKQDVRPGLLVNPRDKRQFDQRRKQAEANLKNKKPSKKSLVQLQDEQREEKLKEEIDSTNKGYSLMAKMGYKPGTSLGPRETGLKVPLPIEPKRTRGGLGQKSANEAKKRKIEERREDLIKLSDPSTYRSRLRKEAEMRAIDSDLKKAQRICQNLDTTSGFSPPSSWFWPPVPKEKTESGEEDLEETKYVNDITEEEEEDPAPDEVEPAEKLSIITTHLRLKYFYCIWCGTTYADAEDFNASCPGGSRDDH